MKKSATLAFFILAVTAPLTSANPITAINISLPSNPDSNTANWGTGVSSFTVTVTPPLATNGKIDPDAADSKILVIIKKDGRKICGGDGTAAGFTSATKVWSGGNAAALLGSCSLPAGDYVLSVQFLSGKAGALPLSNETTKAFSIKSAGGAVVQNPAYLAPKLASLNPSDLEDIKRPITFRWTPVIPKPQDSVTYRLEVWQLMQGQTGPQAIKANQPILTKDVDNLASASVLLPACASAKSCSFVWNVQALAQGGKPIGGNNGTSEASVIVIGYGTQK